MVVSTGGLFRLNPSGTRRVCQCFGPPLDVGDVGNSGEEAEPCLRMNESERTVIGMPNFFWANGIGRFF